MRGFLGAREYHRSHAAAESRKGRWPRAGPVGRGGPLLLEVLAPSGRRQEDNSAKRSLPVIILTLIWQLAESVT